MDPLESLVIPLLTWYNENARDLPWRHDPTAYRVWLSEIMLQQTRVAAVCDYYRRFLARFPTIASLACAEEEELMKLWQGLGYYSRARNLQKAAKTIMTQYGGRFPSDYASIRALSGIGDYTAGAIASIAFGLPTPAVDGNVLRVVTRLTGDRGDITRPATKRRITAALAEVMPTQMAGAFNQALMELGATVCLPNGAPLCEKCPARSFCFACQTGQTAAFPVKAPKKPRRIEHRRVYLLYDGPRVLLRRRQEKGLLAGLWEFPNALESDAPPEKGLPDFPVLSDLTFVGTAKHIFSHIEWHMTGFAAPFSAPAPEGCLWAGAEELRQTYSIPAAFSAFYDMALQELKERGRSNG